MTNKRLYTMFYFVILISVSLFLSGAAVRRTPQRVSGNKNPYGAPRYEDIFEDGVMRVAVFWGWDHPKETIVNAFPAFEILNGRTLYYKGRSVKIEIGMISQINDNPKELFIKALEDPTIDIIIYSGHARYGQGMAFKSKTDIFRSGRGDLIEDRHDEPYQVVRAAPSDLEKVCFPDTYKIIMINACDSEDHFRQSWTKRFIECQAPVDLVTIEYPVYNFFDDIRVLNFLRDLLAFSDWNTIKQHYDSEVHRRQNRLVINPVQIIYLE